MRPGEAEPGPESLRDSRRAWRGAAFAVLRVMRILATAHGARSFPVVALSLVLLALSGCAPFPQQASSPPPAAPGKTAIIGASGDCAPRSTQAGTSYVVYGRRYHVRADASGYEQRGIASWYGRNFHGKLTSSGEPYNMYAATAANKVLPLCTWVKVTNLENGASVVVQINDRGPFVANRIIDLSYAAAHAIGMFAKGTALVDVRAIAPPSQKAPADLAERSASQPVAPLQHSPRLYLQLGAFLQRHNAEALRARLLLNQVGAVTISPAQVNGRLFYRVLIGPLGTVDAVDSLSAHLRRLGFSEMTEVVIE